MKKIFTLIFFTISFFFTSFVNAQNVNAYLDVIQVRHNYDCGNDNAGTCCGCWISICNDPDPRWKFWGGYSGGSFTGPSVLNGGERGCGTWNNPDQDVANFTNISACTINIDMESWEEDGCGGDNDYNTGCVNSDNAYTSRTRMANIDFRNLAPCQYNQYGFYDGNNGYGAQYDIYWEYNVAPTITTQPTSGGADRMLCIGTPTTLTVATNTDPCNAAITVGRNFKWQVNTATGNAPFTQIGGCISTGWNDIPGATSASYIPPQTAGTRLYRCLITSNCAADFSTRTVTSECVRVTYYPYTPDIVSPVCGASVTVGSTHAFSVPVLPNAGAIANATYAWTVSPTGPSILTPTSPATNITFPSAGTFVIRLTTDETPSIGCASTFKECTVIVNAPNCDFIYVDNGTGTSGGSSNSPVSLTAALGLVSGTRNHIRMLEGTYTISSIIELTATHNGIIIEGGYRNTSGLWTKRSDAVTTINCSGSENDIGGNDVGHTIGFRLNNCDNAVFQDLTITTSSASGNTTSGNGKSNYAIYISNGSTGYEITRCNITAGAATAGIGRTTPTLGASFDGSAGSNGAAGSTGDGATNGGCENGRAGRQGGAGGAAGANATRVGGTTASSGGGGGGGGVGGSSCGGGNNNCSGCDNGGSGGGGGGSAGNSTAGGATGGGGDGNQSGGAAGGNGTAGGIGPGNDDIGTDVLYSNAGTGGGSGTGKGGNGGRGMSAGCNNSQTPAAESAGAGSDGVAGTDATTVTAATYSTYYIPGFGNNGTAGQGGGGGGGGGGAGCDANGTDASGSGGSGGSGGGGGGGAGAGGRGGGSSFAVFEASNTNSGTISQTSLVVGAAGGGGGGGNGGAGGTGPNGVAGGSGVGGGRNGGAGGKGGNGGAGGKGANGPSGTTGQLVINGVITSPSASVPNPTNALIVNYNNTKGCTNSYISLQKGVASGNWSNYGTGGDEVFDITSSLQSTGVTSNPVFVYYTSTGWKDITTATDTRARLLRITTPRTLPVINGVTTPICKDGALSLTATPNSPSLTTGYEWTVQLTPVTGLNAPVPVATSNSATPTFNFPNTGTTDLTYQIKLRVQDECCGWSIPVYQTVVVKPTILPGTINTGPQTICYNGDPANITSLTAPSNLATAAVYKWQYRDNCTGTWNDIASSNAATYDPPTGLTVTRCYRRVVTNCSVETPTIEEHRVDVLPQFTVGAISGGSTPVCTNGTSTATLTVAVTGGSGIYGYEWFFKAAGGTCNASGWTSTGNNDATFTPTNVPSSTMYMVMVDDIGSPDCGISTQSSNCYTVNVRPVPTAGVIASDQGICPGTTPSTITSTTAGTVADAGSIAYRWESSTTSAVAGFGSIAGTAATYSPGSLSQTTWYRRITVSTLSGVTCESVPSNVVAIYTNDNNTDGVLATSTSSKTCTVNDANWHYFRNSSGQIIAAINSNGVNLGDVTMSVTINPSNQTTKSGTNYYSNSWGNGGIGRDGSCLGMPELSMRRWYQIIIVDPTKNPPSTPSSVRLFFNSGDYTNYSNEIVSWDGQHSMSYPECYGYTVGAGDLVVSKDETIDLEPTAVAITGGPGSTTQYDISVPSFSTFRWHTRNFVGSPLPVELLNFTGYNEGIVNKLQWSTASEKNTEKFVIEKSLESSNWLSIGENTAAGNSTTLRSYDFNDNNPIIGNNYYRLKIIDLDGTFTYSDVINIPINTVTNNSFVKVYPNPTNGILNIDIQSTSVYDINMATFDVLGKKVLGKSMNVVKGLNTLSIDYSTIAKGTYILQYSDGEGKLHTTKFVKD